MNKSLLHKATTYRELKKISKLYETLRNESLNEEKGNDQTRRDRPKKDGQNKFLVEEIMKQKHKCDATIVNAFHIVSEIVKTNRKE